MQLLTGLCRARLYHREDQLLLGWDSAFEYEGQTYAEMPKEEKNRISHRGKALDKLKAWLKENTD